MMSSPSLFPVPATSTRGRRRQSLGGLSLALALVASQPACSGDGTDSQDLNQAETGGASSGGGVGSGGTLAGAGGSGGTLGGGTGGAASGGTLGAGGTGTGGLPDGTGGEGTGGDNVGSGGDDGSGGNDGTGGTAGFQPCPETGPCKILPLGDSITVGYPGQDGYRVPLFELAVADSHDITFVGTKSGGPMTVAGQPFPRNHEGVSGETVEQIANRVPSPALNDLPHIVLVHAGTNDLTSQLPNPAQRVAALVDELTEGAPDALIVVAKVIPIFYMLDGVKSYNASIESFMQERINMGKHILVVDHLDGYPQSELGDTVHPNGTGYARMASTWYAGIEQYLR